MFVVLFSPVTLFTIYIYIYIYCEAFTDLGLGFFYLLTVLLFVDSINYFQNRKSTNYRSVTRQLLNLRSALDDRIIHLVCSTSSTLLGRVSVMPINCYFKLCVCVCVCCTGAAKNV